MSLRFEDLGPDLRPTRALLHPLWLGSLAVLVLNDHVLKGASIVPAAVTGKLSDLAGLIVAPVLLAALLRVRGRRGWVLSHVAVGLVFAAIQLSAVAAAWWSGMMAAVGAPWVITRDATDLVALPALLVSAWALRGAMLRPTPTSARRRAELVAAGAGLVCCAATSPPTEEPFRFPLFTDVYVHNTSDAPVVVRMRALADSVDLDCNAVAADPARLISEPLFGDSQSFLLDPDQNFGLRINNEWDSPNDVDENGEPLDRSCYAVLLDVDGLPPAVAFWEVGSVPLHEVPGEGEEDGDPRGRIELQLSGDPDTLGTYEAVGDDVLHVVPAAAPPVDGSCGPQSDAGRLEWSDWSDSPSGEWELLAVDRGADGCFALELGTRDGDERIDHETRWYLCAPLLELELEPGRLLGLEPIGAGVAGEGGFVLRTIDARPDLPRVELQAFRGTVFPQFHGLQVAAVPEFDCGYVVGPECGTVTRATSVTVGGGSFGVFDLGPGERETVTDAEGAQLTAALAHAEERAVLDPECAEGPDVLGLDLEVVALYVEPAAG